MGLYKNEDNKERHCLITGECDLGRALKILSLTQFYLHVTIHSYQLSYHPLKKKFLTPVRSEQKLCFQIRVQPSLL